MSAYSIVRAGIFAFQSLYRNFWLTIMTVTILVLALISVSTVIGLNSVATQLLDSVKQKVDISVPLTAEASPDEGRALAARVADLPEVREVRFVSSEEALEQFTQEHADDPNIQETLELLEENPLPPRILIRAHRIESFASIFSFLNSEQNNAIVQTDTSELDEAQLVVDKLANVAEQIRQIGLAVTGIFLVISFLVVFNTVRINIYTHKEEIGIMKLVGATNWFVRTPFLIEGVLYALVATLITFAILAPILSFIAPHLNETFFSDYNIDINAFFVSHIWFLLAWQFIAAAVLNMASAAFATSRYLKV